MEREVDLGLGVDLTLVQAGVPLAGVGKVKTPGAARPLQEKNIIKEQKTGLLNSTRLRDF